MSILNENVDRIRSVMGLISEDNNESPLQMNVNLRKTVDVLNYLKLYNKPIENMLMDISYHAKSQIIDFGLLERGFKKVLLKKGDKRKNVEDYLLFFEFSITVLNYFRSSTMVLGPKRVSNKFFKFYSSRYYFLCILMYRINPI
jgi:hypothetical protein